MNLPRPLWIGLATVVLIVVAAGRWVGTPIYRRHAAIQEMEWLHGKVEIGPGGPDWLRGRINRWPHECNP